MNWTKVTPETMPPDMAPILVTMENENVVRETQTDYRWNAEQKCWVFFESDEYWWPSDYGKITHWMPMPKPAED